MVLKISITRVFIFVVIIIISYSCSTQKVIEEDEYLLQNNEIILKQEKSGIKKSKLENYYQQSPNSKFLFLFNFKLWVYSVFYDKKGTVNSWIREKMGEPPVIYDKFKTQKTSRQLELYLNNQGYLNSKVTDSVNFLDRKAEVYYQVNPGTLYTIDSVEYNFGSSVIREEVLANRSELVVKEGEPFDMDMLKEERSIITDLLRNNGYYDFSKQYIYYEVDTAKRNYEVDVTVGIRSPKNQTISNSSKFKKYRIDSLFIMTKYDPNKALKEGGKHYKKFDTLNYKQHPRILLYYDDKFFIKSQAILKENFILPDSLYRQELTDKTYRQLLDMGIFKFVNITYKKSTVKSDTGNVGYLNAYIQLTPKVRQSYSIDLEGTNTSGNFGVAGNVIYEHKNLFHGSERLNLRMSGAREAQGNIVSTEEGDEIQLFNTNEYGVETRFQLPDFLFPFFSQSFSRTYNPSTNFSLAYNYQQRPDYTRTVLNLSFGYSWKTPVSGKLSHYLNPLTINMVNVPQKSEEFIRNINNPYVINSYENQMIAGLNYTMVYEDRDVEEKKNNSYFYFKSESAGNILNSFSSFMGEKTNDGYYELFGIRYAQYLKGNVDYRFYQKLDEGNEMVYRIFGGMAYPYGNSDNSIPFIKKYYSGGANSIRAWQVRSLGPGSYRDTSNGFNNQLGAIKLETNIEYRFDLFWTLEGGLFLDLGNIWELPKTSGNEDAIFRFNRFYKQMAIGTGVGLRFDFSFFILRFDFGLKLRNPALPKGEKFIFDKGYIEKDQWTFNFGIGYPF